MSSRPTQATSWMSEILKVKIGSGEQLKGKVFYSNTRGLRFNEQHPPHTHTHTRAHAYMQGCMSRIPALGRWTPEGL